MYFKLILLKNINPTETRNQINKKLFSKIFQVSQINI